MTQKPLIFLSILVHISIACISHYILALYWNHRYCFCKQNRFYTIFSTAPLRVNTCTRVYFAFSNLTPMCHIRWVFHRTVYIIAREGKGNRLIRLRGHGWACFKIGENNLERVVYLWKLHSPYVQCGCILHLIARDERYRQNGRKNIFWPNNTSKIWSP